MTVYDFSIGTEINDLESPRTA